MEEYKFGGSKGSGTKSSRMFLLKVEAPTTTTTTTTATTTTVLEDYPEYSESENTGDEKDSEEYHDHGEEHNDYDDIYPETSEEDLHSHDEEYPLIYGEDPHDVVEEHEHDIREHSEAMTEHEFLDHYGANETLIESSRLHVDELEARDSQLIENVRKF